ncbi:MAG: hypothetical protein KGL39_53110 [Patescibacteria group bacterium]|nr:hypothetical protein [Patescibacteria group bacterium]
MNTIRKSVIEALKRSGMTKYQVAKKLQGRVPRSSVYAYLGGGRGRDIGSDALGHLMRVLQLEIVPKRPKPETGPKRNQRKRAG